jgi:hypothetical protein
MIPIYVAIPSADGKIDIGLARWLLANKYSEECQFSVVDFSQLKPLESNMKFIFTKFLESGEPYLLWIDNDITPYDGFLDKAVDSGADIYGGRVLFWQPQFEGPMVCAAIKAGEKYIYVPMVTSHKTTMLVDFVGFGCVLIKREVIQKLMPLNGVFEKEYWPTGHVKKGLDVLFCERAKMAGFQIVLDDGELMDQTVTMGLKHVAEKFSNIIYKTIKKTSGEHERKDPYMG